jgi:hypothetical protein
MSKQVGNYFWTKIKEWQDSAILGKKLKKPSRTPEEVSQAKKQYEQKRSRSFKLHWITDRPWLRYNELLLFVVSSTVEQQVYFY